MLNLTKTEYQILSMFYNVDMILSKSELLEKMPMLNPNSTAATISSLLRKGYLEVAEIRKTRTSLSRAYKPSMTLTSFLIEEFGISQTNLFVKSKIKDINDYQTLDVLLAKVKVTKLYLEVSKHEQ